jgi:hypothetical protein
MSPEERAERFPNPEDVKRFLDLESREEVVNYDVAEEFQLQRFFL